MPTYLRSSDGAVFASDYPQYHPGCEKITKKEYEQVAKARALAALQKLIKPGGTVYTVLRHCSSSGMSRRISAFVMHKGVPLCIDSLIEDLTHFKRHSSMAGLVVHGAGMDMGFHIVYTLGAVMWPKGTRRPHGTRNGEPDRDGGYALKQQWL